MCGLQVTQAAGCGFWGAPSETSHTGWGWGHHVFSWACTHPHPKVLRLCFPHLLNSFSNGREKNSKGKVPEALKGFHWLGAIRQLSCGKWLECWEDITQRSKVKGRIFHHVLLPIMVWVHVRWSLGTGVHTDPSKCALGVMVMVVAPPEGRRRVPGCLWESFRASSCFPHPARAGGARDPNTEGRIRGGPDAQRWPWAGSACLDSP